MNAMLKYLAVAASLAAGGCAITPGYGGGGYGGYGGYGGPATSGGYGYPSSGYGGGGYPAGGQRFRCESDDGRQRHCRVDTGGGVQLLRQLSSSPCVRGRTWDYDRGGVWVSQGCRAEFAVGYGGQGGQYGAPGYPGGVHQGGGYQGAQVRCESTDGRTRECAADTRGGVSLARQLSSSPCVEGRTWGYGRNSIWVSQGCRGQFVTGASGAGGGGNYPLGGAYGQTVRCESSDNRQRRCSVPVRSGVQLVRQLSGTPCIEGSNWGWDRNGVWVDRGCRAEFSVR